MALAFQCDRCGKLFLPKDGYVDTILIGYRLGTSFSSPHKRTEIDLCPECRTRLEQWAMSCGKVEDLKKSRDEMLKEDLKNEYERMVEEA